MSEVKPDDYMLLSLSAGWAEEAAAQLAAAVREQLKHEGWSLYGPPTVTSATVPADGGCGPGVIFTASQAMVFKKYQQTYC